MKYSIHQTDESNYSCIIGFANDNKTFINTIENTINKLDNINEYECISIIDINSINNKCGYFLVHHNDNKYELIHQYNKTTPYFVFNTVSICKRTIFAWILLDNSFDNQEFINEENNDMNEVSDDSSETSKIKATDVKNLNINKMVDNANILFIAKRGTNKHDRLLDIINKLQNKNNFKEIIIVSPIKETTEHYNDYLSTRGYNNKITIMDNLDYTIIEKLMCDQRDVLHKKKQKHATNDILLVLDDCLSSKGDWLKNPSMTNLFLNSRHYGITLITAMQFPMGLSPEIRSMFDYVFMFADDFVTTKKRLYDFYAGMFPNYKNFDNVFTELTTKYGSMIISNTGATKKPVDKIFK